MMASKTANVKAKIGRLIREERPLTVAEDIMDTPAMGLPMEPQSKDRS